ncbi:MAG TPA: hypothetical protein VFE82_09960 [Ramlibacter sp.]|uniref:hypothetical protein n=1 Tax=Ramlibacter sp. TaxID=1917967 RepID=UPI002D3E9D09|nr:hypothetical protein [Ramlibacter sp.]HZY18797.1 hypothetical protein [Ramlibacter sp.]
MELLYLDFDFSDEASGAGSFDAMASVAPPRLPALLAEVGAVLRWAARTFGAAGALHEDGEWDYELQAVAEPGTPLEIRHDPAAGAVSLAAAVPAPLTTLTLTLVGTAAFCDAFRQAFGVQD